MKVLAQIRRFTVLIALALLVTSILPHGTSSAASFNFNAHITYRVENATTTAVTETYTVTNQTAREFLTQVKLTTPVDTISGLEAHYSDGGNIPLTSAASQSNQSGVPYNYQQLTLAFPRQNFGSGKTWTFVVSYSATGLIESHGGAHTVFVPAIAQDASIGAYTARVDVPQDFGAPHFRGAQPAASGASPGRLYFDFNQSTLSNQSLALSFGNATIYQANFNFPLHNDSRLAKTMTITLPPNLNNQHITIESLDPKPAGTRLDTDGNILADYRVPARTHLVVKTLVTGEVKYLDYNLAASGKQSDIPSDLVKTYTAGTKYWQTDGSVAAAAKQINQPNAPVIDNVRASYQYVVDHLTYNPDKIKFNIRQGAAKALANPTNAVCLEYSDLLVALLRAQGIPARMPVGYGYSGNLKASDSVVDSLHSWVEAYVPGIGWMTLDPTWGEKFDLFGQSDLDHFAFAVWGGNDQLPVPVMAGGQDTGYQYEQTTLTYAEAAPQTLATVSLHLSRYSILPFINLERISVSNASQQVISANSVSVGNHKVGFGNLAPGQTIRRFRFDLGHDQSQTAQLTGSSGAVSLVMAQATVSVVHWPLGLITLGAVLGLAYLIMVRLRPHRLPGIKRQDHD
ncbi:MAG TPA: transglutaminase family protein [Candidatus Saccharimonadales bacterium]|nr:transglutaminase family protein [Candidatus Saccharimonadales bacterium]